LRREIINLVRLGFLDHHRQGMLIQQVCGEDLDLAEQMLDPLVTVVAGAPDNPHDLIALAEQQLGKVGAVLAGDTGN